MRTAIAITCFFLSGFAGLIYEVCWIREASLVFGSTLFAVSTVLAVFFLGLALWSYLFGRIAQTTSRPLRLFAWLELGVGAVDFVEKPLSTAKLLSTVKSALSDADAMKRQVTNAFVSAPWVPAASCRS